MASCGSGKSPELGGNSKRCRQEGGFRAIVRNHHRTVVPGSLICYGIAVGPLSGRRAHTSSARLLGEMLLIEYTISALLASAMKRSRPAGPICVRYLRSGKRGSPALSPLPLMVPIAVFGVGLKDGRPPKMAVSRSCHDRLVDATRRRAVGRSRSRPDRILLPRSDSGVRHAEPLA